MSELEETKLIARNAPALRKLAEKNPKPRLVAGNPISARLESGIGNCFPGLECDLRNLERRFFPFLEMDMPDTGIALVAVDIDGAVAARKAGEITQATLDAYMTLHTEGKWVVETMTGTFGPLGRLTVTIADLDVPSAGARRQPPDPWTAVRLLTEGSDVRLVLQRKPVAPLAKKVALTAKRAKYLGDDGALAAMFLPGELTQSLCSPWTHDFRDCGCYYWASNHPDIALPPLPEKPTSDPKWNLAVPWERRDRTISDKPPSPATTRDPTPVELRYFEINHRWQSLNFVLERREQIGPYQQREFAGKPLASRQALVAQLRYAAGVELAVMQEYLAAMYSLKPEAELSGAMRDDVRAAQAEIKRIAIGEMRHLRAVNNVLASLLGRPAYKPALGVASKIPGAKPGHLVDVEPRPLTKDALKNFIMIEAPSESVDGVYANILATLNEGYAEPDIQAVRTVMAEGEDHYRTFLFIQEWLKPYLDEPRKYLRAGSLEKPPPGNKEHQGLQVQYLKLLDLLYRGYNLGMPEGAASLNAARDTMISDQDSIVAAAEKVAAKGYLVAFDIPADSRFKPVPPP
jgi:hypothetical protein